jgi:hypothetical protein
MWCVALFCDPVDSLYKNIGEEDKKQLISTDFLDDPGFNWESPDIIKLIEAYKKLALDHIQASVRMWQDKIKERDDFIVGTEYDLKTAKILDELIKGSSLIYDTLKTLEQKYLEDSGEGGNTREGVVESASEKGLM